MSLDKHTTGNDLPKNSPDNPQRPSEASKASLRQQITLIVANGIFKEKSGRQMAQMPEKTLEHWEGVTDELVDLLAAQQTALLEDIRKNGTYLKKDSGFAPGLWLKVDIIDEALSKLRKEQ